MIPVCAGLGGYVDGQPIRCLGQSRSLEDRKWWATHRVVPPARLLGDPRTGKLADFLLTRQEHHVSTLAGPLRRGAVTASMERFALPGPISREWAWVGSQGHGVSVCVIDSGIKPDHPDVGEVCDAMTVQRGPDGYQIVPDDAGDVAGHRTACAGGQSESLSTRRPVFTEALPDLADRNLTTGARYADEALAVLGEANYPSYQIRALLVRAETLRNTDTARGRIAHKEAARITARQ